MRGLGHSVHLALNALMVVVVVAQSAMEVSLLRGLSKSSHTSTMCLIQYLDYFHKQNGHGMNMSLISDVTRTMTRCSLQVRRTQIESNQVQSIYIRNE